jgi:hypothetical protein
MGSDFTTFFAGVDFFTGGLVVFLPEEGALVLRIAMIVRVRIQAP